MTKIYVLDTNVLLHDPKALFAFADNEVVIPLVVLDELDKKKTGQDEVARNARMTIRFLDEMRSLGSICDGVKTERGGVVRVEINHQDCMPADLDPTRADNRIISVALGLKKSDPDRVVTLISKDINLRVKADALRVAAVDYNTDAVADNVEAIYSGTGEVWVPGDFINDFYAAGTADAAGLGTFFENQYLQLKSETNPQQGALARYSEGRLVKVAVHKNIWGVSPRNREQIYALDALFNPDIKLVSLIGTAGCGKTLMACAAGISQLLDESVYKKMILTRPIAPMGKDIGYLPGTKEEKLTPYMSPFYDNMDLLFSDKGSSFLKMQMEKGLIEIEAMTYIRGRSLPKVLVCADECQNLSRHEIKTLITRIGDDSKIILTGDIQQIDTPFLGSLDNGLSYTVEKFKNQKLAATVTLTKGERSELATLASDLL